MANITFTLKYIFVFFVCAVSCLCSANARTYKVALIHSYEEGYVDADRTRKLLETELKKRGVFCEFREYYLNCDEFTAQVEEERISYFIDDLTEWGTDLVAVFDDQATYSLMACGNSKIQRLPVVFSGVIYPNDVLLKKFPNVTGYADPPDYFNTIRMVERIMGKSRICVINGRTILDRMIWRNLAEQCNGQGFKYCSGDLFKHISQYRTVKEGLESTPVTDKYENERFDTTFIVKFVPDSLSLRNVTWAGRGSHTLFLYTKCDHTTVNSAALFCNPCFETINEGFGVHDHKMGGYFTTLETQLRDMAVGISQRLRGEMPISQVQYCVKQYVLNWHTLQRYKIPIEDIPAEYIIMYIPFSERYYYHLFYGSIFVGIVVFAFIAFLIHSLLLERRRKREAQRNQEYEHETLKLAIGGGATYAWRLDGGVISCDSQFYELIHYPQHSIVLDELIKFIHPDSREEFCSRFSKLLHSTRHKGRYLCSFSGEYQWWEFRYNTITSGGKSLVTGLLQNIQDVKDREDELIEARKLAEHAELKQSFLNNMSHEIRTPLNAIAGFSNMLVCDPDITEDEKLEFVDIINTNTQLLLKLVDDVLELSRIESGSLSFKWRRESVRMILERIYQTHRVLIQSPLELYRSFPAEDVFVYVDSMRLTQVLTNFLNNANKFTQNGYIKLGYYYVPQQNEVYIYVEDTGMGISAEELKMIFGRFYKHNEFSQGVGLGLSISQLIVDKMKGRIEVDSQVGKGSRFIVILPCVE